MPSRAVAIADEIVGRHPDVTVGGLLASNLRAAAEAVASRPFPGDTADALAGQGLALETLASHPLIAGWRAAIAACGLKPSTYKSSPEQLARRTLKSGPVRTGLALVDLYCEVATRHVAPLGGYDVDRLPPDDIRLRLADPTRDRFAPLGVGDGDLPLTPQVAVYAGGPTVLCWAYNCRDSRETCLTEGTDAALFLGEAVTVEQQEALRRALDDLAGRLAATGAEVGPVVYADRERPRVDVTA